MLQIRKTIFFTYSIHYGQTLALIQSSMRSDIIRVLHLPFCSWSMDHKSCNPSERIQSLVKKRRSNSQSSSQLQSAIRHRYNKYNLNQEKQDRSRNDKIEFSSLAAEKHYALNAEKYEFIGQRQRELEAKKTVDAEIIPENTVQYPLEGWTIGSDSTSFLQDGESDNSNDLELISADRGFYIDGGRYVDDYVAGSVLDIPGDEMTDSTCNRFGPEDAVEVINFQYPGQSCSASSHDDDDIKKEFWLENYGTMDLSVPSSSKSCFGCGANFHCKDSSLPGFLPVELFMNIEKNNENLCRRCYMLKKYNFLLNVNVCEVDYRSLMKNLRLKEEVLILLVVDLLDLPSSIYADLPNVIGYNKPMIVIGNKVDLLPPDPRSGYLRHFRSTLSNSISQLEFHKKFNILHTALISAKTGFGIEQLITNIFMRWTSQNSIRNDIYMVGCVNVGKSSLFNALLQSDLCKVQALDLVERATTSIWPGTTISLLKFPVMNPTPFKMELRRRRLVKYQSWLNKERKFSRDLLKITGDSKYVTLHAYVGNTYKEVDDKIRPMNLSNLKNVSLAVTRQVETRSDKGKDKRNFSWSLEHEAFTRGKWCYDTPGTVNNAQILDLLTLDELVAVLPRRMILPRTFIIYPKQTLLIGGLARIDAISSDFDKSGPIFISVFASDSLPINLMETKSVKKFLDAYLGSSALVAPCGDRRRLSEFPQLKGEEMLLRSNGNEEGCADVILSSVGWACLTAPKGTLRLLAHTPDARGLHYRTPPILPFCAGSRGARIAGSQAYKTKPAQLPLNMMRAHSRCRGG